MTIKDVYNANPQKLLIYLQPDDQTGLVQVIYLRGKRHAHPTGTAGPCKRNLKHVVDNTQFYEVKF